MTTSASPPAAAVATARMPGIDVARALAVLGMVLVNYKAMMGAALRGPDWLTWLSSLVDGRAAALFVVLAGVGISLRSRRARQDRAHLPYERASLLKRAAFLFVAGLLNLHIWDWDILHCYGAYLAIAAFVLTISNAALWLLAFGCLYLSTLLSFYFNFSTDVSLWSPYGMMTEIFFDGLYPVFPWVAFLFIGMWLGRQGLHQRRARRWILLTALAVVVCFAVVSAYENQMETLAEDAGVAAEWLFDILLSSEAIDVFSRAGTAVMALCLCIAATQERAERRWVMALVATGQLAFTLYIAHAVAILIPQQHGLLEGGSLALSIAYSLAFYSVAMWFCVWWRRRWPQGPLEGIIRQITGRTSPAPWGGERLP